MARLNLANLASRRLLLMLNLDALHVRHPTTLAFEVPPNVRAVLHALLGGPNPTYILTRQRREDVATVLGVPTRRVVGLNGMQWPGEPDPQVDPDVLRTIVQTVPRVPGLRFEHTGVTLVVRFHGVPLAYRAGLERALDVLPLPIGWEVVPLDDAREFRPMGFGNAATAWHLSRVHSDCLAVFIGTDGLDEAAYVVMEMRSGVGIKLGTGVSCASHRVPDVGHLLHLLGIWADAPKDAHRTEDDPALEPPPPPLPFRGRG